MDWRTVTKWLLAVPAILWVVYDWIPASNDTKGDTISEVMQGTVSRHPALMALVGILVVHLFIPATALGRLGWRVGQDHPWVPMLAGAALALLFWSQKGVR